MVFLQYIIPKHLLSKIMFYFARLELIWLKNFLISKFIDKYKVNLSEAKLENISDYNSFNDFFTRELKNNIRPISKNNLVSPVDGTLSQLGIITKGNIISAKNRDYSIKQLLATEEKAQYFADGNFYTFYLSPKDYHRVHMPINAKLLSMVYVPGNLFSVNKTSIDNIQALLARNERLICYFKTNIGEIAVILVGAIFVGSMEVVWHGRITPPYGKKIKTFNYQDSNITINKGDELGRFNMGSTVILLLPQLANKKLNYSKISSNILMGENL